MMLAALALAAAIGQAKVVQPDAAYPPRYALCRDYCVLVDGKGTPIGHRLFDQIDQFDGPVAVYEHQGKHGAVDRDGRTIIKPVHDKLWTIGDGFLLAPAATPCARRKP